MEVLFALLLYVFPLSIDYCNNRKKEMENMIRVSEIEYELHLKNFAIQGRKFIREDKVIRKVKKNEKGTSKCQLFLFNDMLLCVKNKVIGGIEVQANNLKDGSFVGAPGTVAREDKESTKSIIKNVIGKRKIKIPIHKIIDVSPLSEADNSRKKPRPWVKIFFFCINRFCSVLDNNSLQEWLPS